MRKKMGAVAASTDDSAVIDTLAKLTEIATHILAVNGASGWSSSLPWLREIPDIEVTLQPFSVFLIKLRDEQDKDLMRQVGGSLDSMFESAQSGMDVISGFTNQIAKNFGTTELFRADDFKPFEFVNWIGFTKFLGTPPVGRGLGLDKIPVSKTFLLYIGYMTLDVIRLVMTFALPDMVRTRQLMSLVLGIMDVLGGNWKNAIISMAGIFTSSAVAPGFVMKMAVSLLGTMPGRLQKDLTWMVYRATKAMVVGFMVQLFLLVAPLDTRLSVMAHIQKIATQHVNVNKALGEAGLPAIKLEKETFGAAAAVGTVWDPEKVCSTEFGKLVPLINESVFLTFAAQLVGLPTTEGAIQDQCKALYDIAVQDGYRTYGHMLAAQGLSQLLKDQIEDETGLLSAAATAAAAAAGCGETPASTWKILDRMRQATDKIVGVRDWLGKSLSAAKTSALDKLAASSTKVIDHIRKAATGPEQKAAYEEFTKLAQEARKTLTDGTERALASPQVGEVVRFIGTLQAEVEAARAAKAATATAATAATTAVPRIEGGGRRLRLHR